MTTNNTNANQEITHEAAGGAAVSGSASPMAEFFGEVISSYTRAQAIKDGVLVDLSAKVPALCREHYKWPIACTAAVWSIIESAVSNKRHCNDLEGVIHDILWMSRKCAWYFPDDTTANFRVTITGAGRQRLFTFKMVCGPGDTSEPVLTLMLEGED